jgi:hypothetical protein
MESQSLNITKFIKIKDYFNHFWNIYIFNMLWHTFFYINIFFTSYENNVIYLTFDFFGFWFAIIWKKIKKSFDIIMIWLKFKPCTFTKQCNVLCDNNFDSLVICFYPQLVVLNVFLTLPNVLQHFLFYLMASHFSSLVQCLIIPQKLISHGIKRLTILFKKILWNYMVSWISWCNLYRNFLNIFKR